MLLHLALNPFRAPCILEQEAVVGCAATGLVLSLKGSHIALRRRWLLGDSGTHMAGLTTQEAARVVAAGQVRVAALEISFNQRIEQAALGQRRLRIPVI